MISNHLLNQKYRLVLDLYIHLHINFNSHHQTRKNNHLKLVGISLHQLYHLRNSQLGIPLCICLSVHKKNRDQGTKKHIIYFQDIHINRGHINLRKLDLLHPNQHIYRDWQGKAKHIQTYQ